MVNAVPPPPRRRRRPWGAILVVVIVVAGGGYWWWTNRPAGIIAITIWLPDGRAVAVPAGTPEFEALAAAVKGIVTFDESVATSAANARISFGALFAPWKDNPDAVCVDVTYDRALGGDSEPGADRVVIGSRTTHIPDRDLVVSAGLWSMWAGGEWLKLPIDQKRINSSAAPLGTAVAAAAGRLPPADAPTIPAPSNVRATMMQVDADGTHSTGLDTVPHEAWDTMAWLLRSPLKPPPPAVSEWMLGEALIPRSRGTSVLRVQFTVPILMLGSTDTFHVRAVAFAWLGDARHGVAWVETDRGIYRWRAQHIDKSLELFLYRAGTYGPGATAPPERP